ncbi:L-rhamnose mutarotase [Seonamhaeicola algicola]|uniref:L-rhamnose mutarotase n=1 Tax=Seonamhaeicola algicola TaxID=1719036 RepID=A0A5C7B1L9_9FLAO|nr:L-rhamnose mutarotase [Seonamhaeicola algicola]TXE11772.1 L-rhamnose mutarotase [Seonamhaeicola algicola]
MSAKKFKRFTYLFSEESTAYKVIKKLNAEDFQKHIKKSGILSIEVYQKSPNYFVLIDTEVHLTNDEVSTILSTQLNALERIYEFEQKEIYKAKEGQLKTRIGEKKRFVWTLLLQEDETLIEEYKEVHSMGKAWPEITNNMKTVGVKDMEIYLSGTQAILIMDTKPDFNLDEVGPKWQKLPREEEWQAYVAKFQRTDPNSSIQEKWQDMRRL